MGNFYFNLTLSSVFILFLFSCADSSKNIETESIELSFKDVFLKENGKRIQVDTLPKVRYGTKLEMYITDFEGYQLKDGKAFLGCAVEVKDTEGNQIQKQEDILKAYEETGIMPEDAKNLMTSMLVNSPLEVGKKYIWTARLWDKNGLGEITASTQIEVVSENPVQITEKGLSLEEAFIISYNPQNQKNTRVHNTMIQSGTQLKLHFAGLADFEVKNEKANLGCTLEIKDQTGQLILLYKDMFQPYSQGVSPKEVEQMTINLVTFKQPTSGNRYDLFARIWDKNTDKSAEITLNFEIVD